MNPGKDPETHWPHAPELVRFLALETSTSYFFEALTGRTVSIIVDYQELIDGADGRRCIERHARLFCAGLSLPVMYANCLLYVDQLDAQELAAILEGKRPLGKMLDPSNDGLIRKTHSIVTWSERPDHSTRLGTRQLMSYTLSYQFEVGGRNLGRIQETVNEESVSRALPDRLLFRSLIRGALNDAKNRSSVLADTRYQCSYPECLHHLDAIQEFLTSREVQAGDCIAVALSNSVLSALTILALFDGGYSVMIVSPHALGSWAGGHEFQIPLFCRWTITVGDGQETLPSQLPHPSDFLGISPNPNFEQRGGFANQRSSRLYLSTSGSLGTAKLAVHTYGRLRGNILRCLERLRLKPSHRIALPVPIFHMYGLGAAFLPGIAAGASIDFQAGANLLRFFEREEQFNPNVAFVTPTFCALLLRGRRSPRPYEFIVTAGDRISDTVIEQSEARHGPLINLYGTTEMGVIAAGELTDSTLRFRTVGRPLPGVHFRFVEGPIHRDTADAAGELQLQHAYGFEGYVDPQGNAVRPPASFDGEWYCTRDLARPGPDGTLIVLGRSDLSVNRNGMLLALAEVENGLRGIAGVEEAAVASGADTIRGCTLIAFCVLGQETKLSGQELRTKYAQRAPAFAVPDIVRIVDSIPKLPDGKLDRQTLASLAGQELSEAIP